MKTPDRIKYKGAEYVKKSESDKMDRYQFNVQMHRKDKDKLKKLLGTDIQWDHVNEKKNLIECAFSFNDLKSLDKVWRACSKIPGAKLLPVIDTKDWV